MHSDPDGWVEAPRAQKPANFAGGLSSSQVASDEAQTPNTSLHPRSIQP